MSGKRTIPRTGTLPEYNIALLGALGVGKSGNCIHFKMIGHDRSLIGHMRSIIMLIKVLKSAV